MIKVASIRRSTQQEELRRLKAELRRVTEERDILKRGRRASPASQSEVRVHKIPARQILGGSHGRISEVERSGFAWLKTAKSRREREERLLGKIKQFWVEIGLPLWLEY